jgi:capsular exopolysaccharide synthesis family protein
LDAAREAYRSLRTRLLRSCEERSVRSLVITSSTQGEGKTLTSLGLATCCAQLHDTKILLIDADIRTQGLSRLVGSPAGPGLCEIIAGQGELSEAICETDLPNLSFLGSGASSTSPTEVLASERFREIIETCSEQFKLVIVDSPPVLNLADADLIAAACDGVLMVVRAQATAREVLEKSIAQIDNKKLLGSVYNASEVIQRQYKYTYGGN